MFKILMFVNWPVSRVSEYKSDIRNPNQVVLGDKYWFSKYWPKNVEVDVLGLEDNFLLKPLEELSRVYLQHSKAFNILKKYDLLLTFDSPCSFLFSLLKSKTNVFSSIPHVMIDVGLPNAYESHQNFPKPLVNAILKQSFNKKSISHIIFYSARQRTFYRDVLGFPSDLLSYVPFGVEQDYFKPERIEAEDYIYSAGEARDFDTLLTVYERWHDQLPELRIRSMLPKPANLPPNVKWLPRASVSTFKDDVLKAKFVIVPLHRTLRSIGLMTCLQSMALGKTVLTSQVPAVDGYVKDEETAFYYEPYNPVSLFSKLSILSQDDALTERVGKNPRQAVETEFTVEKMGEGLWDCISRVLKG